MNRKIITKKGNNIQTTVISCMKTKNDSTHRETQKINPGEGEQYIVILPFSFDFSGCMTRRIRNAAKIVLFKSRINWQVDVQLSIIKDVVQRQ